MSLNPCQEKAKTSLVKYILGQPEENEIILTGGAGTGKTYTLKEVMDSTNKAHELLRIAGSKKKPIKWILTATTNKAKEALQDRFPSEDIHTIHSILGLIPKNGKLVQKINFGNWLLSGAKTNVIVIDECSYIDPELMYFIDDLPKEVKVIYLGDECQLSPVGHSESPVFAKTDIQVLELSQQMRQANSPLLRDYCEKLVAFIKSKGIGTEFPTLNLNEQLVHLSKPDFDALLHKVFITDGLSTQDHRVLSYSNKVVTAHNNRLFEAKEGRDVFQVGDIVINNHYIKGIPTDAQVTITKKCLTNEFKDCEGIYYYLIGGKGGSSTIGYVPDSPKKAKAELRRVIKEGIRKKLAKELLDCLVDLRPMYACTVHKSQGSTFDTVYLDLSSFNYIRDDLALARLLYVAISRAKTRVVMTGDIT